MVDLTADTEASVELPEELSLSSNQLSIERIISKVFTHYHCDVIITDRLRSLFTSKLWRMGKAFQSLGGTGRARQLKKWKDTAWMIELQENEVIQCSNARKRKPDNVLSQSARKKCMKLESELKESNKKLKEITNQMKLLENSSKKLSSALINSGNSTARVRSKKRWSQCSPQYQRRKRKQIAQNVQTALSFVSDEDFQHTRVELRNNETGEVVVVNSDGQAVVPKPNRSTPNHDLVKQTLYVKERYNLSNAAYHELSMVNSTLPRSCALMKAAKELDIKSIIRPTPGKITGVQQSLTERLVKCVRWLMKTNSSFTQTSCIRVKLTGDGTAITCCGNSIHYSGRWSKS